MEDRISGHTGLMALFGSPIGHSGSPAMYNYSFAKLGLDYVYVAIDTKLEETEAAIAAMRTYKMRGGNVTMPGKTVALRCMDELSPTARLIGAVNTIVNENGRLIGYNTDGYGFVGSLEDAGVPVRGKKMTLVGGGGAAAAIIVQCAFDGMREIAVFKRKNESFQRTVEFAAAVQREAPACAIHVYDTADTAQMKAQIADSEIFANATVVGMTPMDGESVLKDVSALRPGLVVVDVVYNPLETRLLREAREAGCLCIGGKGMLLWQGVAAFWLFTGQNMPVSEVKELFFQ